MSCEGKVHQICTVRPESMLSRSHNKAIYIRRSSVDTENYEGKVDIGQVPLDGDPLRLDTHGAAECVLFQVS